MLLNGGNSDPAMRFDAVNRLALAVTGSQRNANTAGSLFNRPESQIQEGAIFARWALRADFENAGSRALAMRQERRLAILPRRPAFSNVDELHQVRIVVDFYSHRGNVRRVRDGDTDGKRVGPRCDYGVRIDLENGPGADGGSVCCQHSGGFNRTNRHRRGCPIPRDRGVDPDFAR